MDSLGLNVTMSITNIGTQGYPGTGKTSLLDLTMGKDPAPTRNSTDCVDPPSYYLVVKSEGSDGVKWDHVTTEKMFDMVCEAVNKNIDENPSEKTTVSTNQSPSLQRDGEQVGPTDDNNVPTIPKATQTKQSLPSSPSLSSSGAGLSQSTYVWFCDLLERVRHSNSSGVIFDSHWMMVTDSGGQPPFLDAAALFLRNNCLQIFTLKLNELLKEKPNFSYFIGGKSACFAKSNLRLTNQQILETLARTVSAIQPPYSRVQTLESPQGAKFTIVGTFEDKAHQCSETIQEKEAALEKVLKPYKPFQVRYGGKVILPVNAIATDKDKRQKLATKLRNLITRASGTTMKIVVKLRWFGFLLIMLTTSAEKPILKFNECLEIGEFLCMDESEIRKAIAFFHEIGLIMHFDTPTLRNYVIVDAKPLLKEVSRLISASFVDEEFLADHCDLILPPGSKDLLQQHGRFTKRTLESFLKFTELMTVKFFLDVLEHVKAVVAINKTPDSAEYFMPCALPYATEEQCVPCSSPPWVIMFRIKRGIEEVDILPPVGYLPALVVFLLTRYPSHFCIDSASRQYRNQFELKYRDGGLVYITEHYPQLEIFYTLLDAQPKYCLIIRNCVLNAMYLTEERLRLNKCSCEHERECVCEGVIDKIDSFLCLCGKGGARHLCNYNHQSKIAICVKTNTSLHLKSTHLCWIQGIVHSCKSSLFIDTRT